VAPTAIPFASIALPGPSGSRQQHGDDLFRERLLSVLQQKSKRKSQIAPTKPGTIVASARGSMHNFLKELLVI